jgi:hypothetical protein
MVALKYARKAADICRVGIRFHNRVERANKKRQGTAYPAQNARIRASVYQNSIARRALDQGRPPLPNIEE